jgi:transcription initiation factor TFIIE subunit alpha
MKDMNVIVFDFLEELLGEGGVEVASMIFDKEATDEEISNETGIRINTVRKVLYRLYDNRLASYRRIRDKKTGWFIYYWKMEITKAPEVMRNLESRYLSHLQEILEYEKSNMFFSCENECKKYVFEAASDLNFTCPDCGKSLNFSENRKIIEKLENQIRNITTRQES